MQRNIYGKKFFFVVFTFFIALGVIAPCQPIASKLTSARLWKPASAPFSFQYAGRSSAQLLREWHMESTVVAAKDGQIRRYSYTDPATHLRVSAEIRLYPEFPGVVDWVLRFRNEGTQDTPILEDILPLDLAVPADGADCVLRHAHGSSAKANDFEPLEETFGPGKRDRLESSSGWSSSGSTLPFFNLQTGSHGMIGAIGWTGRWKTEFEYAQDGKAVTMTAGMIRTHLRLHPGEEIRTPRIVLMSWSGGDWQEAQNRWRRLLFTHYTPQENGRPMRGPVRFGSWGSEPIAQKLALIQSVHARGIPYDVYAVDAGWYGDSVGAEHDPTNPWWKNRGDWFPSPRYYPAGIHPLGGALKADNLGFSLWIEPETAQADKKIAKDHPDWFLRRPASTTNPHMLTMLLANLGNPAARQGLTEMVSGFITDFGMTWYRQDFNQAPNDVWDAADTPDRIGMTEIGHVEGLYEMWDDLLAQHPGLRIDNCASGGRRLDIEMLSRSFAIWRTDYGPSDKLAEQAQTQALAFWVPENMGFETYTGRGGDHAPWKDHGAYTTPEHLYLMRLAYDAGYNVSPGSETAALKNDAWVAWIKQAIAEYREVQPYFYGDFYPLLPYSQDASAWTAWQWNRPEKEDGLVMVMRRPKSSVSLLELHLKHLRPKAFYEVEVCSTYDKAPAVRMTGAKLAQLKISLAEAPSSVLVFYHRD